MQELGQFMSLVSDEKQKVQKIQEEKDKRFKATFRGTEFGDDTQTNISGDEVKEDEDNDW